MSLSKISILRGIQKKKEGGFIIDNKKDDVVAIVRKGKIHKFINKTPKSTAHNLSIHDENYIIEPYIPLKTERVICFLSGEAGSGKTLMTSILIKQFLENKKSIKAYYICNTNYRDDINLKDLKLVQIDTGDGFNIDEFKIEDFSGSLFVIDDTDFHKDHKKIMKIMNIIVECGRKFNVSLIYSSHIHSKLSESPIYKEVSMYITFPNAMINNRMISNNLQIPEDIKNEILETHPAYICFNKIYRTVITDKIITTY